MSYSGVKLELYTFADGVRGGLYQFRPSPMLDITREVFRNNDGTTIGGGFNLALNGSLLPSTIGGTGTGGNIPGHDYANGTTNINKTFEAKDALIEAVNRDLLTLKGTFVPVVGTGGPTDTGCPEVVGIYANSLTIQSIDFSSPDQWTQRVDYTIEMFCPNSISIGESTSGTPFSGATEYTFGSDAIDGTLQSKDIEYSVSVYDKGSVTSLTGGGVWRKPLCGSKFKSNRSLQTMLGTEAQQGAELRQQRLRIDRAVNALLNMLGKPVGYEQHDIRTGGLWCY